MERDVKFLVEELKVMTEAQAKDRVFFVSAKEALNSRIPKTLSTPDASMSHFISWRIIELNLLNHIKAKHTTTTKNT